SWGSLSQFSPNLQQPMPTIATLSRIACGFMFSLLLGSSRSLLCSALRRALPIVVGRSAGVVDLAERELDRQIELRLLGDGVGHLDVEARAVDVGDGRDQRRVRAAGEVVEGERLDGAELVRQAIAVELVLRVTGEADALVRILDLTALAALLRDQADVAVAVAEVLGRRDAGAGAAVVLRREELAEADVDVVIRQLAAAGSGPTPRP